MDKNMVLKKIDEIMALIGTADAYAASENRGPVPSLWQIHNANIFIAVRDLENMVKQG